MAGQEQDQDRTEPATPHKREEARIGDALALRKTLKDLNPDFLSERAFDPAHAIPEPNDFPLFLDVHWSPPKE